MKGLKVAGTTAKGIGTGVYKVGEETVVVVYNTVAHPIQTGAAMWDAVRQRSIFQRSVSTFDGVLDLFQ